MNEEYLNFFKLYKDDTIFSSINKNFISLQDEEIKENNQHLRRILTDGVIPIMKRNTLFNEICQKIKYAGSFYKGTKVAKPNEYDLDLIVQLPLNYMSLQFETDHEHYGYVKIKVEEKDKLPEWEKHNKILNKWVDRNGYLDQNQFRQWMESVMAKTFEQLEKNGKDYELTIDGATYLLRHFSKSGPAFTLYIRLKDDSVKNEMMSVDLVPSLEFRDRLLENYKVIPDMAPTFVVIPKPLDKIVINGNNLWRLSFYDQEKQIFSEKEFAKLKPIIRMLKKFRDRQNMKPISSYFIETLCLHELSRRETDVRFFRGPLTGLFLFMLRRLSEVICIKCLPFFWHEEHNLLGNIDEKVMENYCNRIQNILKNIEKRYVKNRFLIAEQILSVEEFENLLRKIADGNPSTSPLTSGHKLVTDEQVGNCSQTEDFDIKHITDEMMKNYNIDELTPEHIKHITDEMMKNCNTDELTPDEMAIIVNELEGQLPPDVVEEIQNACKNYVTTKETNSYWNPFTRFLNKVLSPRTIMHSIPIMLEILHGNRNKETTEVTTSENFNKGLYKSS